MNKIERNRERDKEEQRKLAEMGWHCIVVWECQLKPDKADATLSSLEFTLNRIYLDNHAVHYKPINSEFDIAAEPYQD